MRYRILFISSWYPNRLEPTNGNFVKRHAAAAALIHDVEVLHAIGDRGQKETYIADEKVDDGMRSVIVYYRKTSVKPLNFLRRMNAYRIGFRMMSRPDLVHANIMQKSMLFAVWLKIRFGIPYIITEHWSMFLKKNRTWLSRHTLLAAKIIATKASAVLPVSRAMQENLLELGFSNDFHVVGNVVDSELFSVSEKKTGRFIFLHVSNLVKIKNPDKIIRTAAKLHQEIPGFELHIGGDGDRDLLNKLVDGENGSGFITTFGPQPLSQVAEKMQSADCFILFSDYENFPCVLLESISTGTPVIATDVGGVSEIVNTANGILIDNDEDSLYNAMKTVLQNVEKFDSPEEMHESIRSKYSPAVIGEKLSQIYTSVLQK